MEKFILESFLELLAEAEVKKLTNQILSLLLEV
jgi:hypothetical protein